jgi:hypothetical protein
MPRDEEEPFDLLTAPALLGFAGGKVESIAPFLPEAYWVILRAANGQSDPRIVVVEDGRVDLSHGRAAAARYLRRVRIDEHAEVKGWQVAQLLDQFGALPGGFRSYGTSAHQPTTKETGGLTLKPFALKLMAPGYEEPWPPPREEWPPGQPPPPMTRPGPVGGPAGPPGPSGPPGAAGVRQFVPVARAILHGDETRHYVWTVDLWDYDTNRWVEKRRIPLEP